MYVTALSKFFIPVLLKIRFVALFEFAYFFCSLRFSNEKEKPKKKYNW